VKASVPFEPQILKSIAANVESNEFSNVFFATRYRSILRRSFNQAGFPIAREIEGRRWLRLRKPKIGERRDIRSAKPMRGPILISCPPTCILWSLRPIDFHSELIALLGPFVESEN
jgi:hypothetical protein